MKPQVVHEQARSTQRAKWSTIARVTLVMCMLVLSLPAVVHAQDPYPPWPLGCKDDKLGAQEILICIPPALPGDDPLANWNGQLVVYAHGYVAPQEGDPVLPAGELGRFPGVIELLLYQGYAFATTSYSKNGYAVAQAEKDLNALVRHFKTKELPNAGLLEKVLIVGASEGGLITTMMVEKYPGIYDGGLAMCGPLGGLPAHIQYLGDFRVVFDVFFPQVFRVPPPSPPYPPLPAFGMADVPEDAYEHWDLYKDVLIPGAMLADPPEFKVIEQFFDAIPKAPYVEGDLEKNVATAIQVLYYNIVGTPDMIATARGMPYDNLDTVYGEGDVALNEAVERIDSDGRARAYVRRAYQPNGELEVPLVTLHNTLDPAVPYWHEAAYGALAGPSGLFVPITIPGYGHCEFTPEQVLGAFEVLTTFPGQ